MAWIFEVHPVVLFFLLLVSHRDGQHYFFSKIVGIDYWTNQTKKKSKKNIVICI